MKDKGFTLIELMVAVAVVSVLAFALVFYYQGWIGSYNVESQTKNMYIDLMNARARAMGRNRVHFVVVAAGNYRIFEDTNENSSYDAGTDLAIPGFASAKTLTYSSNYAGTVTMDAKGLISSNPASNNIQFSYSGTYTPDYDCIVIDQTRLKTGKMTGGSCVAK